MILTSSPVQNIGHLFHGVSLASPSHALKYGFRTANGSTGGVRFEAPTGRLSSAEPATTELKSQCIVNYRKKIAAMFLSRKRNGGSEGIRKVEVLFNNSINVYSWSCVPFRGPKCGGISCTIRNNYVLVHKLCRSMHLLIRFSDQRHVMCFTNFYSTNSESNSTIPLEMPDYALEWCSFKL